MSHAKRKIVATALLNDLMRRDGEHGCLVAGLSPDMHVILRGHVDLNALAEAAIAALRPKRLASLKTEAEAA